MRRYFVDKNLIQNNQVTLKGDLFHHIIDVCRQAQGSKFEIITEEGHAHFGEIISLSKKEALFQILETRQAPTPKSPHIHLILSIPKLPTLETIIEKSVELGVSSIHLAYSDFSFLRKSGSLPAGKLERWHKIIIAATQQSGRGNLMKIQEPKPLKECLQFISATPGSLGIFAYEGSTDIKLKDYVTKNKKNVQNLWIIVGSEGGFSQAEMLDLKSGGLIPVTLGDQVLRVETACLALVSVLKYEFDLL